MEVGELAIGITPANAAREAGAAGATAGEEGKMVSEVWRRVSQIDKLLDSHRSGSLHLPYRWWSASLRNSCIGDLRLPHKIDVPSR
jgi:hypothetical protein